MTPKNHLPIKKISLLLFCRFKYIAGLNGGYYSGGLQQAHSTTPLEAPLSVGSHPPPNVPPPPSVAAPPVSVTGPPGIQHALVSKSVCCVQEKKKFRSIFFVN